MLKLKDEELDINRFPSIMFNAFDRTCDIPGLREISLYHYRPGGQQKKGSILYHGINKQPLTKCTRANWCVALNMHKHLLDSPPL